eukprot:CAMPEP_0170752314 /NCGR_PEP_ID=MMETSP0437-20130122/11903_1 /TAXON_ID=0 /ORGANISM="Sexangularia sp." /LENGTH=944 /DNA_ID=CAMNT_0011091377 /DNA_START=91 /DNA_END=2922 /DNA_ORIENTATION=+
MNLEECLSAIPPNKIVCSPSFSLSVGLGALEIGDAKVDPGAGLFARPNTTVESSVADRPSTSTLPNLVTSRGPVRSEDDRLAALAHAHAAWSRTTGTDGPPPTCTPSTIAVPLSLELWRCREPELLLAVFARLTTECASFWSGSTWHATVGACALFPLRFTVLEVLQAKDGTDTSDHLARRYFGAEGGEKEALRQLANEPLVLLVDTFQAFSRFASQVLAEGGIAFEEDAMNTLPGCAASESHYTTMPGAPVATELRDLGRRWRALAKGWTGAGDEALLATMAAALQSACHIMAASVTLLVTGPASGVSPGSVDFHRWHQRELDGVVDLHATFRDACDRMRSPEWADAVARGASRADAWWMQPIAATWYGPVQPRGVVPVEPAAGVDLVQRTVEGLVWSISVREYYTNSDAPSGTVGAQELVALLQHERVRSAMTIVSRSMFAVAVYHRRAYLSRYSDQEIAAHSIASVMWGGGDCFSPGTSLSSSEQPWSKRMRTTSRAAVSNLTAMFEGVSKVSHAFRVWLEAIGQQEVELLTAEVVNVARGVRLRTPRYLAGLAVLLRDANHALVLVNMELPAAKESETARRRVQVKAAVDSEQVRYNLVLTLADWVRYRARTAAIRSLELGWPLRLYNLSEARDVFFVIWSHVDASLARGVGTYGYLVQLAQQLESAKAFVTPKKGKNDSVAHLVSVVRRYETDVNVLTRAISSQKPGDAETVAAARSKLSSSLPPIVLAHRLKSALAQGLVLLLTLATNGHIHLPGAGTDADASYTYSTREAVFERRFCHLRRAGFTSDSIGSLPSASSADRYYEEVAKADTKLALTLAADTFGVAREAGQVLLRIIDTWSPVDLHSYAASGSATDLPTHLPSPAAMSSLGVLDKDELKGLVRVAVTNALAARTWAQGLLAAGQDGSLALQLDFTVHDVYPIVKLVPTDKIEKPTGTRQ